MAGYGEPVIISKNQLKIRVFSSLPGLVGDRQFKQADDDEHRVG